MYLIQWKFSLADTEENVILFCGTYEYMKTLKENVCLSLSRYAYEKKSCVYYKNQ